MLKDRTGEYRLLMVGGGLGASDPTNRATAQALDRLAGELGVKDELLWTGYLGPQEVSAALLSSDIAVLPYADGASFRRGSLLAVLEHGLPVITTMPETGREASRGSNGQREWPELVDGENAVLVLPGDVDGLASAVEKVASDADLRARLAEGAAKVAQFFSWARIAGSHADLYTRLMRSRVDQG